jgi:phosphomevalonate kinase
MTETINVEIKQNDKTYYAMIQFLIKENNKTKIISRVYTGKKEINEYEIKKLIDENKSNLILLNNKNKLNDIEMLDKIIQENYEYTIIPIDFIFNFIN